MIEHLNWDGDDPVMDDNHSCAHWEDINAPEFDCAPIKKQGDVIIEFPSLDGQLPCLPNDYKSDTVCFGSKLISKTEYIKERLRRKLGLRHD